MAWRNKLDPTLKGSFEDMVMRILDEREAYMAAKKPSIAQLWTAIAILTKQVSDLELRLKKLEKPQKTNKKLKQQLKKF